MSEDYEAGSEATESAAAKRRRDEQAKLLELYRLTDMYRASR